MPAVSPSPRNSNILEPSSLIKARINKAKAQMGLLRHFLGTRDIDWRIKKEVYLAGPLNTLLWGCESWNVTEKHQKNLHSFHHSAICRILGIKWDQVQEQKITNEEVRKKLNNILHVDMFIIRWTCRSVGKVIRSKDSAIARKLLGAWIHCPCKIGHPQNSCNNNSLVAI